MPSVKTKTMANGMKIVLVPHKVGSVTACLRGLAGSNYEKPHQIGAAHILEHLSTFRSKIFSKEGSLRNIVLWGGGRVTGTTSRDDVAYLAKTLTKDYKKGLLFLSEVFFNPILDKTDFEKTKRIVSHEIFQNIENPSRHIGRISYKILYPQQRFSFYNTGDIKHVNMLELSTLKEFRNDYYHPANFVLSVCGDLDEKEFFRTAEELFSHGEKRPKTLKPHHQQNHDFAYQIENRINIAQLHLKIDYHGFSTGNKDKYATFLLARLFKYKLNQLLLAAFTSTKLAPYILDVASFSSHSYGLFGLYTSIKPQDLPNFLLLYRITIAKILSGNFSQKDLKYLKNKINADFEYTFEKTSLRADFYSELFLYDQLTDSHGKELQKHLAVNINDLNKVAKKIFSQKPKITIVDKELTNNEFVTIWNKSSALI